MIFDLFEFWSRSLVMILIFDLDQNFGDLSQLCLELVATASNGSDQREQRKRVKRLRRERWERQERRERESGSPDRERKSYDYALHFSFYYSEWRESILSENPDCGNPSAEAFGNFVQSRKKENPYSGIPQLEDSGNPSVYGIGRRSLPGKPTLWQL